MDLRKRAALLSSLIIVGIAISGCNSHTDSKTSDSINTTEAVSSEAASNIMESNTTESNNAETNKAESNNAELNNIGTEGTTMEPITNLAENFIFGMDASIVKVEENSGVVYYDFDGNERDVLKIFADAGINYIRLRVWNDPYDENGNGYGGGNNDLNTAIELGKRATEYGMKVCVDFHYSDFWADPKRQHAPKAWEGMSVDEKCDALYEFTRDSLTQLLDAGVDVGMVQVGNETNHGMAGEYYEPDMYKLMKFGSRAVREISAQYERNIQIALHFTEIKNLSGINKIANSLDNYEVDYDIFAISFYPFWDGSIKNMTNVVKDITAKHGKQVVIAETSYAYTLEDGDGCGNSFKDSSMVLEGYPATVEGQTRVLYDIIKAANEAGATGIFYWEGAWIPVGKKTDNNSPIWEKYGSGWASSYASDYDPEDAGKYYGGCSWDNQALFDFSGHPLETLRIFKRILGGDE